MAEAARVWIVRLALALAVLTVPLYGAKVWIKTDYSDFLVYHRTAERLGAGEWVDVYNLNKDGNSPFRYAPPTLPFFRPWAWLYYDVSRVAWFVFQYLCFIFGFASLRRVLRRADPKRADFVTAVSFLFALRFCLDSFMIGQVTGVMFLLIAWALEAWSKGRPLWMGAALFFPAALKVGPGILFGALLRKPRELGLASIGAGLSLALATILLFFQVQDIEVVRGFFGEWWQLLLADSQFFDSSHYGTQSLKSALLRAGASGYLPESWTAPIHIGATVLGCALLAWLWSTRKPRSGRGLGLYYALGVLAYLVFMPFTFKYSLPLIAFPVAFLLARTADAPVPMRRLDWTLFGLAGLLLPLAGPIFTGDWLFFFLQKASFPFLAILGLTYVCAHHAYWESEPK